MNQPADHTDPDSRTDVTADAPGAREEPDAGPVDDPEAQAAADGLETPPQVAEHYQDYLEKAANLSGEGAV